MFIPDWLVVLVWGWPVYEWDAQVPWQCTWGGESWMLST
jgi:hypothetical protein